VAEGFHLKPDSWRVILPKVWYRGTNSSLLLPAGPIAAGKRIVDFTVLCRDNLVDVNGVPSLRTAATWHQKLLTYTGRVQDQLTLIAPDGVSWVIAWDSIDDRLLPLGGQWLVEWEVRCVALEL